MPRTYGKKGIKENDDFVVESKEKKKNTIRPDSLAYIEQLQQKDPFWIKDRNMLSCFFCGIVINLTSPTDFKIEISAHVKSELHQENIKSYKIQKKKTEAMKQDKAKCTQGEQNKKLSDVVKVVEYHLSNRVKHSDRKCKKLNNFKCVVDFETIYSSLIGDKNKVVQKSRKFISKNEDGKNYFCKVCQELIFYSLDVHVFRHNLWTHINDEKHREKLPNFPQVEKDFKKQLCNLSKKVPEDLRDDFKYFGIGPVFDFVECSLCSVAVSINPHRLQNHIAGQPHQNMKKPESIIYSKVAKDNYNCSRFARLIKELEVQFKEDTDYVHIGKLPGYVVCSLCSEVVLPTYHYMTQHFMSDDHVKNKTTNLIKFESKFKTDMMEMFHGNLIDHKAFRVTNCGIKCCKCFVTIPATPYALYCHMKKSGCVTIS